MTKKAVIDYLHQLCDFSRPQAVHIELGFLIRMPADVVAHFDVGTIATLFDFAVEVNVPAFQIQLLGDFLVCLNTIDLVNGMACISAL